jgi:IS30 family transposase
MNKHLSSHQRYQIEIGLAAGSTIKAIAQDNQCHPSTIYREIARNQGGNGYKARFAQQRADTRAKRSRNAKAIPAQIWRAVEHYVITTDSPEQIADRLGISYQAIYSHVWRDKCRDGCLWLFLRSQRPYRKRCGVAGRPGKIPNRRPIDNRPAYVERRAQVGHVEADTIVGPRHASAILTVVDRKSGYLWAALLAERTAIAANAAMVALLGPIAHRLRTVTTDNGGEFALHERLDARLGCTSYFCDPYCSWQRGTNENTNGLIRQFLPKSRDLSTVTHDELNMIVNTINHRPRKRLGFKTPHQVFIKSLHRVAIRS